MNNRHKKILELIKNAGFDYQCLWQSKALGAKDSLTAYQLSKGRHFLQIIIQQDKKGEGIEIFLQTQALTFNEIIRQMLQEAEQ